jgi:hypothetical protein
MELAIAASGTVKQNRWMSCLDTVEDIELMVNLEELEGAPSAPSFLLGLPVVDVLSKRWAAQ